MADPRIATTMRAAGLGAIAGMRSLSAPALVRRERDSSHSAAWLLPVLAAGEMAVDKLPWTPDRTRPLSLAGRAASGAVVAAAVAGGDRRHVLGAALLGAAAAVAAAFAAHRLRRWAGRRSDAPDAVLGLMEDAAVLAAGRRLARRGA